MKMFTPTCPNCKEPMEKPCETLDIWMCLVCLEVIEGEKSD